MSWIGVALIVVALIALFLMRARRGVTNQPFFHSMMVAAITGLIAVGVVMVVAGFASR